ncbi:hypothetical protein [Kutzneria sp. CA-103260]|uniref:hypothetical protein n=1 Tax=Kutzneria sp. CA-103260 TaxID=2802641 RepID=UPI001BA6BAD8|nr:hypothetical protein [Kutzneria sp. CA-103260]
MEKQPVSEASLVTQRLRDLRVRAGHPSLDDLRRLTGEVGPRAVARSTIQDKLSGNSQPSLDQLIILVRACCLYAQRHDVPLSADLADLDQWRELWYQAKGESADRSRRAQDDEAPPLRTATADVSAKESHAESRQLDVDAPSTEDMPTGDVGKGQSTPLSTLEVAYRARLAATRQRDAELFRSVGVAPTYNGVRDAIDRAYELGMIPSSGCRVALPRTILNVRFLPGANGYEEFPLVRLEDSGPEMISLVDWAEGEESVDFLMALNTAVQAIGRHPGDDVFDPTRIFVDLQSLLEIAYALSIGSEWQVWNRVTRIVEFHPPQWVVTEDFIVSVDPSNPHALHRSDFQNDEKIRQMLDLEWVDRQSFARAHDSAKGLVGLPPF